MKKNILLIVAIAIVGTVTVTMNNLRAQDAANPATPPAAGQVPPPGARPGGPPPGAFRNRAGGNYRTAVVFLKRAKMDLEHATDDYDGHRQTALDAVNKALQELEAVQASIQAAAAKAAAAQQPPSAPPAAPANPAPPQ